MGFWGPKMQAALDWSHANGIPENLPVSEWARQMDEKLGVEHIENAGIEETAEMWLRAIAERK